MKENGGDSRGQEDQMRKRDCDFSQLEAVLRRERPDRRDSSSCSLITRSMKKWRGAPLRMIRPWNG